MFWLCSTYASTMLELCFDCAWPRFRMSSTYVSTVLDLCLDCGWPIFSTVLDLSFHCGRTIFNCARLIFRLCSTYISNVLDLCFDCSRLVSTMLDLSFDCARLMFRLCSTYVSTFSNEIACVSAVLDLWIYRARPMHGPRLTYVSTFSSKIGYYLTWAQLKTDPRTQIFGRKTTRARFSKLKHRSSNSTRGTISSIFSWQFSCTIVSCYMPYHWGWEEVLRLMLYKVLLLRTLRSLYAVTSLKLWWSRRSKLHSKGYVIAKLQKIELKI